jgi:hypothetical protein|tara:strand:+ start:288 stop:440 length:153 start_codon:yes stop_codon:yes gene_type:complete
MKETPKEPKQAATKVYTHRDLPDIQEEILDSEDRLIDEEDYNVKEIRPKK